MFSYSQSFSKLSAVWLKKMCTCTYAIFVNAFVDCYSVVFSETFCTCGQIKYPHYTYVHFMYFVQTTHIINFCSQVFAPLSEQSCSLKWLLPAYKRIHAAVVAFCKHWPCILHSCNNKPLWRQFATRCCLIDRRRYVTDGQASCVHKCVLIPQTLQGRCFVHKRYYFLLSRILLFKRVSIRKQTDKQTKCMEMEIVSVPECW